MHVVIYEATSQTLSHVAPEVISTATYEIVDLGRAQANSDRVLSSGSATVPSFSLTLDATAGPSQADSKRIPVTLTAGPSIGDVVVVTDAAGAFEAVTVDSISTDDAIGSKSFLARSYASGSTVQGVTITAAATTALTDFELALDNQRPLAIIWTYTTGAGVRNVVEPIQLSRGNRAAVDLGPAMELVRLGYPDLPGRLLAGLELDALAEFSRVQIVADLRAHGVDHTAFVLGETGAVLLAARMVAEAADRGYSPGSRDVEAFRLERAQDYSTQLNRLTTGTAGKGLALVDTEQVTSNRTDPTYRAALQAL